MRYGSLAMSTSPGRTFSMPYSSKALCTASSIVPMNSSRLLLTAGIGYPSDRGPEITAAKSYQSRRMIENAVFSSPLHMCSTMYWNLLLSTVAVSRSQL
jgi:hypothetical protein